MLNVLRAEGPAADRASAMMLYGQFVGSWEGPIVHHDAGGAEARCQVHFDWVLEGRAIQDVWITPSDGRVSGAVPAHGNWYGTTLRVFDPRREQWTIVWVDPKSQFVSQMIGRKIGEDIVQEYRTAKGLLCQWRFTDIGKESFRWIRRESRDDGETWMVKTEVFLQRRRMKESVSTLEHVK